MIGGWQGYSRHFFVYGNVRRGGKMGEEIGELREEVGFGYVHHDAID